VEKIMTKFPIYLMLLGCTSVAFTAAAAQQPSEVLAWRQSQKTTTTDPYTAYTYTRFSLVGRYAAGNNQSADPPALMIDCIPGADSANSKGTYLATNLRVGSPLKIIYVEPEEIHGNSYFPEVAVKYTAGDSRDVRDDWSVGADKTSVSVPRRALKKLLDARTVAIVAQDDHGAPLAIQFNMPDPTPVAESCNLDLH
jgi:hypothetical protein